MLNIACMVRISLASDFVESIYIYIYNMLCSLHQTLFTYSYRLADIYKKSSQAWRFSAPTLHCQDIHWFHAVIWPAMLMSAGLSMVDL